MRRIINLLLIISAWFAVVAQYYLALFTMELTTTEATIRYFSYFTIITNLLVAVVFTWEIFKPVPGRILTAITVYITIVGSLYQILLKHLWEPTGLQKIIDVLFHSVNPLLTVIYWFFYCQKGQLRFQYMITWSIFPVSYLAIVMVLGVTSGFYPYPFINIKDLGYKAVFINAAALLVLFISLSALYIFIGNNRNNILRARKS